MATRRKNPAASTPATFSADPTPPDVTKAELAALEAADLAQDVDPEHLEKVTRWIAAGLSEHAIVRKAATELKASDPRAVLRAGVLKIAEHIGLNADAVKAVTFEAGWTIYRRALKAGDYKAALAALKFCNESAAELAAMEKSGVQPAKDE